MKPVYQSRFGQNGNCLAACFASMLECPLEAVDFSCGDHAEDAWAAVANEKLRPFGVYFLDVRADLAHIPTDAFLIGNGMSGRGRMHSVIYQNGRHIHDPHPDGGGIVKLDFITLLVRL